MPPWGRPSWGRNGGSSNRRRKEWERQQKEWETSRRFEELDSDSDIDEGVDIDYRQEYSVSEASDSEDDYDGVEDTQIALRDKEEVLVARAMTRIRRAQELGKENVKLTKAESDALERRMAKDRAKGRKPVIDTQRIPPKKAARQSLPAPTNKKRGSRSSLNQEEQYNDKPRSRTGSSNSLQQVQPLRRRTLPDDPNWRPRSSSSAQPLPYPLSPQEMYSYGYAQPPPGYRSGPSRHVSGPAEIGYPHLTPLTGMPNHRTHPSSSDPSINRRAVSGSSTSSRRRDLDSTEDDEDEDDADNGVQVEVVPSSSTQGYEVVSRNPGPSGRASQSASLGRRRGGKR